MRLKRGLLQARLSRFQGANAISSADYYDNGEGGSSSRPANNNYDVTTSEIMSRLSVQVMRLLRPASSVVSVNLMVSFVQFGCIVLFKCRCYCMCVNH